MTEFVVFQPRGYGVSPAHDPRAGHYAGRDPVLGGQIVWFVVRHWGEIRRDVLTNLFQIRLRECFDARSDSLVAQDNHRHIEFAGEVDSLDGGVKTVLNIGGGEDNTRRVTVASETSLVQVRLFDTGGHARGGASTLNIADDQRDFGHHCPAQRLGLERDAGPTGTGDRDATGVAGANGHRDGGDFVFALYERSAVFGQFATQDLHDVRPGSD